MKSNHLKYLSRVGCLLVLGISLLVATSQILAATQIEVLQSFGEGGIGIGPKNLILGQDGHFYGATNDSIFKIDGTGTLQNRTILVAIDDSTFVPDDPRLLQPRVLEITQASNGMLYGMVETPGFSDLLRIFIIRIDPAAVTPGFSVLSSFGGLDESPGIFGGPANPAGLTQASDGHLYGTTERLSGSRGTIFRIDINATPPFGASLISLFDGASGRRPTGGVVLGKDGKLYGTASLGGNADFGTIFRFDPTSPNSLTVLHHFDGITSQNPVGPLLNSTDGKLYGIAALSGGASQNVIFQLDISGATPVYSVLSIFPAGLQPYNLVEGTNNKIYSLAMDLATNKTKLLQYDLSGATPSYQDIFDFDTKVTKIILGKDANFYGLTETGGQFDGGTFFRIKLDNIPVNKVPVANDDSYKLVYPKKGRNAPISVAAPGVLENDTDAEGDMLAIEGVSDNTAMLITLANSGGTVALYADGHFVYTSPKKRFIGTRSFTYQVNDGKTVSSPATVTLTINKN